MSGIIVGIDGSSHSQLALEWAMREAVIRRVPLTGKPQLHVAHTDESPDVVLAHEEGRADGGGTQCRQDGEFHGWPFRGPLGWLDSPSGPFDTGPRPESGHVPPRYLGHIRQL
jgi:hypothetical protein